MGEDLDFVVKSIRRTRNKLGCGFFIIVAFGAGLVYGGIVDEDAGFWAIGFGVFCLLLGALGAKIIWPMRNPEKAPLVTMLRENPEKIAWIYAVQDPGTRGSSPPHTIHLFDVDRREHQVGVKFAQLEELMGVIQARAPRAAVGFTDENRQKFASDPFSLLKRDS